MKRIISIVIPALNERDGIIKTVQAIPTRELERIGYEVQVVVVDNGSDDGTGELARQAGAEVVSEPRLGYGSAFKAGFAHAKGDIIATADADATYPWEEVRGSSPLSSTIRFSNRRTQRQRITRGAVGR